MQLDQRLRFGQQIAEWTCAGNPVVVTKRARPGCECDRGTRSPVKSFHEPQSICLPSLGCCEESLVKRVACP